MSRTNNSWDAIVVGAGLGGLSCAATLAKNGLKVLILEKHNKVGGFATQFSRKAGKGIEYNMDFSLQCIGGMREGGMVKEMLEEIGVFNDLDLKYLDSVCSVKFPDFELEIAHGILPFKEQLIKLASEEKDGIEKLFNTLEQLNEEAVSLQENPPEGLGPDEFAKKYPLHTKYMTASNDDFLSDYIKNQKVAAVLNSFTPMFGMPPNRISAIVYMSVIYQIISDGCEYIQGGGYSLSKAFRDCILKHNGDVFLKNEVDKILFESGKCKGVRTTKGDIFNAPFIVCNAPAPVVFDKMIDPSVVDPAYLNQIQTTQIGGSTIVGLFGLKGTGKEIGYEKNMSIWGSYDLNNEFDKLMAGDYKDGQIALINNSMVNPKDTPKGRSFIQLLMNCDGKQWCGLEKDVYKKKKAELTEILINKVAKFIPDIRERLEVVVVSTPHTVERYTSNPNGTVFGYCLSTTGHTVFRPQPDTPVPGLYLAGAWTFFGSGYISAMLSGTGTARMILGKFKLSTQ